MRELIKLAKPTYTQLDLLEHFYSIHNEESLNLTAIKDRESFYVKHYLDSIYIFKKLDLKFNKLIDIGSGGGFPGIPIAIFYPNSEVILIESKIKKCKFLENAIKRCGINNVKIINERAEKIDHLKADIITSRAVGKISYILNITKQMYKKNTKLILYKGENYQNEIKAARNCLKKNKKYDIETVRVDETFKRTYIIININN
ncbi:MAG: 16S rRNA (guanine(527)-N(7))-methyltransferase RsmG [Deferribacterota bacterium]|nr:16S rRNA (guanine(527)-N(7))-methyltransferase RsmG [Deferribacterota bacterium]